MKLAAIALLLILLVNCEPGNSQGGRRAKVLRMCKSRFPNCQSRTKYKRNFRAGAKCCGRAWTVSWKKKTIRKWWRWMKLCDRNFVKQHNQLFDKYVTGPWWRILSEVRFYKCKREKARLIKQGKEYKNYIVHYVGRQFNNLMKKGSAEGLDI